MKGPAIALTVAMTAVAAAAGNDPLMTARDLYASAAYEQALSELTRISSGAPPSATRDIEAYRAFCLVALGRTAEAKTVAESMLRTEPTLTIDQYPDASPRVAAIFSAAQKRVLPRVIRDEYETARDLTGKNPADVESHLTRVRQLWLERVATSGTPADSRSGAASIPGGAASPAEPGSGGAGVVPPVVVSQALLRVPPALLDLVKRLRATETIEVIIDERGHVDNVTIVQWVNSAYDALFLDAVRTWKYKPTLKDGRPVRFVKTVVIDANAQ